jgi:hypothetical protein
MMAAEKLLRSWLAAGAINDEHVASLLAIHLDDLERERMSHVELNKLRPLTTPFIDSLMDELSLEKVDP